MYFSNTIHRKMLTFFLNRFSKDTISSAEGLRLSVDLPHNHSH